MMTLCIGKATIVALVFLCLFSLALAGNCQSALERRTGANDSVKAQMFPESPLLLNDDIFDEAIHNYPYLVIDCWEIGCPPCKLIEPKIDRMAEEFNGRIVFAKLCIDRNPITLSRYRISRTPTLLVFKSGVLEAKQVGNYPQDDLERIILAVLKLQ